MLPKMILSGIAVIGLTGLASAADMYVNAAPVYVPTWTGCYLGGHAGYGETRSSSQYTNTGFFPFVVIPGFQWDYADSFDNKGLAGGGQGGCQLQTAMFLWGLEGDWSSFRNGSSHDFFASATVNGNAVSSPKCNSAA